MRAVPSRRPAYPLPSPREKPNILHTLLWWGRRWGSNKPKYLWGEMFCLDFTVFLFCISHGFPFHTTHGGSGTPQHHHSGICLYHEGVVNPSLCSFCSWRRVPPSKRCRWMDTPCHEGNGEGSSLRNTFQTHLTQR
ncbi:uncharacterized protein TM35_000054790 [Trypanosoma theileri]|uniref:Uncharacterized protein n=1 Tax=Trypanosoma theileri TaxID=67003 RepID=A0A1X0P5G0_9TRYP|nr:uncharacterized protein TM35_000054790 [Trypanosoma theileri]ORC91883.1 hypothetical protein TM35_000054790 [Trypanosoma theileri]